jgi:uncharacterized protein (DUF58 family)
MAHRRKLRFCREGVFYLLVLLAVVIGATVRQLNLLILLGTVLAGPLAFSLMYGRFALRRFAIQRSLPAQLRADQRLAVDVNVTNRRRWLRIWSIEVEDQVVRQDPVERVEAPTKVGVFFPAVGPRETRRGTYHGFLPRRGRYRFGPLRVSTRFPLGLVRHSLSLEAADSLIVHPKLGRLTHDWTQIVRQAATEGRGVQRRGPLEADFYALRDWRTGDNRRWIHWRSSARRGSLVVRQFEERHSRDLALLVDLWQPLAPSEQQQQNVEKAVSFVATLIAEGCRQPGRRLFLSLAASTFLERSGPASPLFLQQQMDDLALLSPHHDQALPAALGYALAFVPASIPTLLVSTRAIDWDAFHEAAAERNVVVAGRNLQSVDVSSDELARYFED